MDKVSQVQGIERIRFTSPHPKDFPSKLIHLMSERPNICKQIHMPLQAGNDRVLHKMNRTYTKEEFLSLVSDIRAIIPDIALSTDVIVGFPTETEDEFQDTLDVMRRVKFDSAFMFKYSERPNTTASRRFPDDVSDEDKKSRIIRLVDLQADISLEKNQAHVGKIQRVLIDKIGTKKDPNQSVARNDANTIVMVPKILGEVGTYHDVEISSASPHALMAI